MFPLEAGLLCPKSNSESLLGTSVALLVGVPVNALFWGEVVVGRLVVVNARRARSVPMAFRMALSWCWVEGTRRRDDAT